MLVLTLSSDPSLGKMLRKLYPLRMSANFTKKYGTVIAVQLTLSINKP
jgi:hypothetical protein